jgi:predicted DNA-binding antitoxin AbrB/MazE fold protein
MRQQFEVVFENGVLRPVGTLPVELAEHQRLTVSIEVPEAIDDWLADADPAVTLEVVRRLLDKVPGTLAEMVHDEREER